MRKATILLGLLAYGCGDADDGEGQETDITVGMTGASETDSSDFTTSSSVSSASTMTSTSATTATSSSSDDDTADTTTSDESTTGDDPPPCRSNSDCADDEVCPVDIPAAARVCVHAHVPQYEVTVDLWEPADCGSIVSSDLYWVLRTAAGATHVSATVGCPGSWDEPACLAVDAGEGVSVELYDADVGPEDDFTDQICWGDNPNECGPIDPSVLHAGEYQGPTFLGGEIIVRFVPYALCEG